MTNCIVGKKIRAMGPGPLELFSFVVLAILMAMAGGISEHMLTSWSSISFLLISVYHFAKLALELIAFRHIHTHTCTCRHTHTHLCSRAKSLNGSFLFSSPELCSG